MAYDKIVDSAVLDANITTVADAIREKTGGTEALTFPAGMAEAIAGITGGEDLDDVLTEQGELIDDIYNELIESGVKMKQAKIIAPSLEEQIVYADEGYLIDKFKVEPITTELLVSLDGDLAPENINEGVEILGVTGTLLGRKPEQAKTVTPSLSTQTISPDAGYAISRVTVNAVNANLLSSLDADFKAANIAEGVNMFGVTGTHVGGGVKFDVLTVSSRPAAVVNNQIVVLTGITPANVSVSTYAPAEPVEGDIWVVVGESTYGIAQVIEGTNVVVTFTGAKRYDGTEWVAAWGYVGMSGVWKEFSKGKLPLAGKTLNEYTWDEIALISQAGVASTYFSIHDTKTVLMDNMNLEFEIVGFNHDVLANDGGKAGISLYIKQIIDEQDYSFMYQKYPSLEESEAQTFLNAQVIMKLPAELQAAIKTVTKKEQIYNTEQETTEIRSYDAKLFILSCGEVSEGVVNFDTGNIYPAFAEDNNISCTKYKISDGSIASWALSDVGAKSGAYYYRYTMDSQGAIFVSYAVAAWGLTFGFCI